MSPSTAILDLARTRGVLRSRDLLAHAGGSYRVTLRTLTRQGKLIRLGRGIYAAPGKESGEHAALAGIAIRYPGAVICLLSALQLHGLGTQSPHELWVAIENKSRVPKLDYPPLRVARFSGDALGYGVVQIDLGTGVQVVVTGIAKTIADCFKYRNKIGLDVALEALREAWRSKRVTMDELVEAAKVCRVSNVIRPYLECLV